MTFEDIRTIAIAEHQSGRITGKEYSSFLLGALQTHMQLDADAAVKAQQIASMIVEDGIKTAQSAKDLLVKEAQIHSEEQRVASMIADDAVKVRQVIVQETQSAKDLLVKEAQIHSEEQRVASMIADDAVKVRQVIVQETQSAKDLLVKEAQINLSSQQKLTEIQNTSKISYEVNTLLPAQKKDIDAETIGRISSIPKRAYDDAHTILGSME